MTDYSRSNILLPHFEEAEAFLNALDGKDAQFTFQTFDDVKGRQDKTLAHIYHGTFNEHEQTLAAINKRGGGVFVTINETDLTGRKKENILKVRAVFVDLDGSPIQPILDLAEDLQPHIIIESSPNKWHAYWLVDNCSLELFPHIQRALAAKFDGDISVNNIDRVMRLAGFSHNKGESFITRIHTMQDDLYPYSVNKLIVGLGLELEQPTQKKQTFDSFSNATHSGDFETVKRAAQGRWAAIFSRLGIALPPDNKHAPCPACGGTDRFRYDNQDGHGTFICNQGGNGILSGDGFALIQHKTGATSSEVLNMVRGIVMPDYQKSKKYQSANGGEDKIISHIDNSGHKKSQPTVLIEMADDCELFHTSDDEAYAVVKTPTSRQVFAVRSAGFRRYLSQRYFKLFGKGVGNQALQDALITIEAKANFNGTLRQVYKRVANLGDRIYLDLCDEKWRVIEVTAAGWQVLNCSPVMFTRTKDMLSIPEPKNDASDAILSVNDLVKNKEEKYKNIYLLKRFVNVRDEDYPLIYAFILACLRGIKPYPVLLLQGESGTGKTTTARNMRGLIDPSKADVLGKPKDENELKTCANNSYILAIDNLSGLSKDFSDVVCQIATGASSSKRKLYTDNDVETYEIARPIILNGIDDIASRGDLLNRSFQVNLPALNDDKKGDEQELATQYNQAKPVILAAFLDMLSVGLRDYDKIEKIKTSGRFVSLPRFVTAAERGLGLSELFAKTYDQNTKQGVELALETSPLAQALITFMSLKTIWTGTIGELFQQLNDRFKTDFLTLQSGSWPKTPRYLSGELTRLAPQLRQTHIDIKTKKESHGMTITLEKVRKIASLASLASLNNKNNELQDEPSVIVASGLHHSSVINDEVASFSIIEEPSHIKGYDANDANDARFSKNSNNSAMTWEADL